MWKQTLRIISKRQPPSSRLWRSRSNIHLSEIVSSLFPLSQYITLSYSSLMKKPFTSNNMYKIGLRNYKEKHINRVFSSVLYREQRGGVRKWLSTSESLCRIYTQKNFVQLLALRWTHIHPFIFLTGTYKRTRATGSAFIQKGPKALSKGKSYLMERTHKLFLCNTSPSRIKKTKQKQGEKKVVSFFGLPYQACWVSEHQLVLVLVTSTNH